MLFFGCKLHLLGKVRFFFFFYSCHANVCQQIQTPHFAEHLNVCAWRFCGHICGLDNNCILHVLSTFQIPLTSQILLPPLAFAFHHSGVLLHLVDHFHSICALYFCLCVYVPVCLSSYGVG